MKSKLRGNNKRHFLAPLVSHSSIFKPKMQKKSKLIKFHNLSALRRMRGAMLLLMFAMLVKLVLGDIDFCEMEESKCSGKPHIGCSSSFTSEASVFLVYFSIYLYIPSCCLSFLIIYPPQKTPFLFAESLSLKHNRPRDDMFEYKFFAVS